MTCSWCEAELPAPSRNGGRPRRFCTDRCRRAAEQEARLTRTDVKDVELELVKARNGWAKYAWKREERLLALEDELEKAQEKLCWLTAGREGT